MNTDWNIGLSVCMPQDRIHFTPPEPMAVQRASPPRRFVVILHPERSPHSQRHTTLVTLSAVTRWQLPAGRIRRFRHDDLGNLRGIILCPTYAVTRQQRAVPLSDKLPFVRQRCSPCGAGAARPDENGVHGAAARLQLPDPEHRQQLQPSGRDHQHPLLIGEDIENRQQKEKGDYTEV